MKDGICNNQRGSRRTWTSAGALRRIIVCFCPGRPLQTIATGDGAQLPAQHSSPCESEAGEGEAALRKSIRLEGLLKVGGMEEGARRPPRAVQMMPGRRSLTAKEFTDSQVREEGRTSCPPCLPAASGEAFLLSGGSSQQAALFPLTLNPTVIKLSRRSQSASDRLSAHNAAAAAGPADPHHNTGCHIHLFTTSI